MYEHLYYLGVCNKTFLGLPTWSKYITDDLTVAGGQTTCTNIDNFQAGDIWLIAVAVLEMLTRLIGLLAAIFFIYGAFMMVTSSGNPDSIQKSRNTLVKSLIGLGIGLIAGRVVSFVGSQFTSTGTNNVGLPQVNDNGVASEVVNLFAQILGALCVLIITWGAVKYITANGDANAVGSARKTITWALVGFFLVLASSTIIGYVISNV